MTDGQVYVKVKANESDARARANIGTSGGSINVQYRIDFDINSGFSGFGWTIEGNQYQPTVDFSKYVVDGNVSETIISLTEVFNTIKGASYYAGYIVNTMGCGA